LLVIEQWPITCEHNLTDLNQNRKAWIGHAATCLAIGAPEDITRKAWHALNLEQQEAANLKAKEAIQLWEERHERKNNPICEEMGAAGISKRDTGFSAADLRSFWQSSFLPENLHGDTQE